MIDLGKGAALLLAGAALFSVGAWGQSGIHVVPEGAGATLRSGDSITVAREYFGSSAGRVVEMGERSAPYLQIRMQPQRAANGNWNEGGRTAAAWTTVDQGNVFELTFTLNGATFAAAADGSNLRIRRSLWVQGATNSANMGDAFWRDNNAVVSKVRGGNIGDSFVTFEVTVGSDGINHVRKTGHFGTWASLTSYPSDRDANGAVTPTDTSDTNAYSTETDIISFVDMPDLRVTPVATNPRTSSGNYMASTLTPAASQVLGAYMTVGVITTRRTGDPFPVIAGTYDHDGNQNTPNNWPAPSDGLLLTTVPVLSVDMGQSRNAQVAIDERAVLSEGAYLHRVGAETLRGLRIGILQVEANDPDTATILADNTSATTATGLHSSLSGNAVVTVSGPFREGDRVFVGTEAAEMNGSGTSAEARVALSNRDDYVVYVPNGRDDLRPATFTASVKADFDDALNVEDAIAVRRTVRTRMASIDYEDVYTRAYAYGVVAADSNEKSFLRVGCLNPGAGNAGCTVFLDCWDEVGTNYFGELAESIPVNNTAVVTAQQVADAFPSGGWSMDQRGSCVLMSNGDLEVQHNIRAGGVQMPYNDVISANAECSFTLVFGPDSPPITRDLGCKAGLLEK